MVERNRFQLSWYLIHLQYFQFLQNMCIYICMCVCMHACMYVYTQIIILEVVWPQEVRWGDQLTWSITHARAKDRATFASSVSCCLLRAEMTSDVLFLGGHTGLTGFTFADLRGFATPSTTNSPIRNESFTIGSMIAEILATSTTCKHSPQKTTRHASPITTVNYSSCLWTGSMTMTTLWLL